MGLERETRVIEVRFLRENCRVASSLLLAGRVGSKRRSNPTPAEMCSITVALQLYRGRCMYIKKKE